MDGKVEPEVAKGLTVVEEVVLLVIHLDLGQVELDMLFELGEVLDDGLLSEFWVALEDILEVLGLSLGFLGALSSVGAESDHGHEEVLDANGHIVVVALHDGVDGVKDAAEELILAAEARGEVASVIPLRESLHKSADNTSDLLAFVSRPIGKIRPGHISNLNLLFREQAHHESITGSLVLSRFVELLDSTVGGPGLHAHGWPVDVLGAAPLDGPVVAVLQELENVVVVQGYVVEAADAMDEHPWVFLVDHLLDGDGLLDVIDLLANEELLEVHETLLLNECVSCGPGEDDLVVVRAVRENFARDIS